MMPIQSSNAAYSLLARSYNPLVEEFWLISLNSILTPKKPILISRGTLNVCPVHPRDIFREAISSNSFGIIIAHNHPSGDLKPTFSDINLTKRLVRISKLIEIPIYDHLIFNDKTYFSFSENDLI